MPKARDKSVRLAAIGCNADEVTLADSILTMKGITTKVLKYAAIKVAVQGRVSKTTKAGELGLTVDAYNCYRDILEFDGPAAAEIFRVKRAAQLADIDRKTATAPATA